MTKFFVPSEVYALSAIEKTIENFEGLEVKATLHADDVLVEFPGRLTDECLRFLNDCLESSIETFFREVADG